VDNRGLFTLLSAMPISQQLPSAIRSVKQFPSARSGEAKASIQQLIIVFPFLYIHLKSKESA
jgi:hypothetical protein